MFRPALCWHAWWAKFLNTHTYLIECLSGLAVVCWPRPPVEAALCVLALWLIVHVEHSLDHLELLLTQHLAALGAGRVAAGHRGK